MDRALHGHRASFDRRFAPAQDEVREKMALSFCLIPSAQRLVSGASSRGTQERRSSILEMTDG
jgi:hypothetical protein